MTNLRKLALLLTASLVLAGTALAQYGVYGPYYRRGWNNGATTAAGSYMSGMSEVIRANADANLRNAQAAEAAEAARAAELDNRLRSTQTYYENRRAHDAYVAEQQAARRAAAPKIDPTNVPRRLRPTELDPVTGEITWPALLQGDAFTASREEIQQLFVDRLSYGGGIQNSGYLKIRDACNGMLGVLESAGSSAGDAEMAAAKNFINSLAYEACFHIG